MMFKGSTQRAREIGQALRADYLLEGSVRREADRVRITARLIQAADETHLWAETYERHLTDCLSVQADVAARIARSLAVELVPADAPAAHGGSTSASAYQEYLKGRYHWNRPDDELACMDALDRALASFTQALRIEPNFAPAHAMVARVYIARAEYYAEQPRRALEAARTSAKRALDLEPQLAEAHLALGDVRRLLEWDWRGAELAYAQAMTLNPSQESAHRRYSTMLASLSRHVEAVREAQRACELDPLCLVVGASAAFVCYLAGDYEEAIERCRRTIDLDPQYLPAQRLIGAAYLQAGRRQDGLDALEAAHVAAPQNPIVIAWLAHAKATAGDRTGAADRLARWYKLDRARYLPPYHLALAHVGLGAADAAFAALEQAVADSDPALAHIAVEPRFEPIRSDPRYARLLDLLGVP
jgi:tetratricopeptide (TPR) repeat protein